MEYRISTQKQMGPYSPQQLRRLWDQGEISANTFYYDDLRSEWLPVQGLVESSRGLFSVEEAFVRVGQIRLKGCLCVSNKEETMRVFVDSGFVVSAQGNDQEGEFALSRALHLQDSTYEWFANAEPLTSNVRVNMVEYALKHSIARDVQVGGTSRQKQQTETLGKAMRDKIKQTPTYTLVSVDDPLFKLSLSGTANVVGRGEQCDVVIDNVNVSRKHCLLEVFDQGVKVKDLDSRNGTFVNGTQIQDGSLKPGDKLSLGRFHLVLY